MSALRQRILAPFLGALLVSPAFGQQPPPQPPAPPAPAAPAAAPQPPAPAQPTRPPAPAQPARPAQPPTPAQPAAPAQPPGPVSPGTATRSANGAPTITSGLQRAQDFSRAPLFQNPDVGRALNLTNAQQSQLRNPVTQIQARYRNEALQLTNLNAQDRAARMQELESNYNAELTRAVDRVLTPEQRTRYRQLELQSRGPGVFADIAVQRQLNLTRDQRTRLRTIDEQTNRALRELARIAPGNRTEANRRYEALMRETDNQINSVLSPGQRRAWQEMTGERFTFPPDFDRLGR